MSSRRALTALTDDDFDGPFGPSSRANPSWDLVWPVAIEQRSPRYHRLPVRLRCRSRAGKQRSRARDERRKLEPIQHAPDGAYRSRNGADSQHVLDALNRRQ
jgi:hypothetical protein